ncbi:hypothetical protein CFter6_1840 [Collimonas fungivorans]|uniref:Uncharacterized protein n=1 Tax=Collimonas fungivorans TaxID=158899 RepID=A0A127P9V3_9BURK|nr:hypothetical protein [Collimonas fungivorans]AMO94537.1 hypothetical protein CFter6_1840 [Collimonas fungivorans]
MNRTGFFAYTAMPVALGETIERALNQARSLNGLTQIFSWKALDIAGHFIPLEIEKQLEEASYLVADITFLNFNVTYEIGFAIGKGKRIFLVRNRSFQEQPPNIREVGIFDTLGYSEYANADDLRQLVSNFTSDDPIGLSTTLNKKAPVYLLEAKHKTDWMSRVVSRVKKARYTFRNFDPNESPRLSAHDAISHVCQSYGVLVPLISAAQDGATVHNLRGAFIAGLAAGMGKARCILQQGDGPVPVDLRDVAETAQRIEEVNEIVAEFASRVAEAFQDDHVALDTPKATFLQTMDLGSSSAENEMRTLAKYYLVTDAFLKSIRGEAHLVVGRKGSGKSAVFLQLRDRERSRNPSQNIVLDLKPEGYKLVKFKEMMLSFMKEGTLQHTITAFWNYVLLLEICYKVLEKDEKRHLNDHDLFDSYKKLEDLYHVQKYFSEGDFSERIGALIEKIQANYNIKYGGEYDVELDSAQVTELLYQHDVKRLEIELTKYMKHKGALWLLFDNVDKGWPTTGLQHADLMIIRGLIDASRKIEREFSKQDVAVSTVVFLRNDVYELLVQETSDRGKEGNVMLDWTDQDLLREVVRLRIVANGIKDSLPIETVWPMICVSHYKGEDSLQYLIDRSLMRPRFLLNLINQCKASAVNHRHSKIDESDIEKGLKTFSVDILADVEYEINDISPNSGEVLYAFIDSPSIMDSKCLVELLERFGISSTSTAGVIDLLLWYGFLGVQVDTEEVRYIYDFSYSTRMLTGFLKAKPSAAYVVNPAFYQALTITRKP